MPFGRKIDYLSGMTIDFDLIYNNVIKPAVTDAGLVSLRADELLTGALIHKAVFSAILTSDVMIADLTTSNPNVMYELGLRHAAQRSVTILLMGSGSRIPYDLSYAQALLYDLDQKGEVFRPSAELLKSRLGAAIKEGLNHIHNDSPLYEFFPGLRMEFPENMDAPQRTRRAYPKKIEKNLSPAERGSTQKDPLTTIRLTEEAARNTPDVDPIAFINVLKSYRDLSAWDEIVRCADELPEEVVHTPEVLQLLSLALNRRGHQGDQDRAIHIMTELVEETGGDAESLGVLGRIYKDRYFNEGKHEEDLEKAIQYYREGFEKQPTDYYPGVNVVTLLLQRNDRASKLELAEMLPRVRQAVENKMKDGLVGYWELATALHLACVARDWKMANNLTKQAIKKAPAGWMIETTLRDLKSLKVTMRDSDQRKLAAVMKRLGEQGANKEGRDA
jgi:tetratricopeptide (TPR) repeat protein